MQCPDTTCINSEVSYSITGGQLSAYQWSISGGGSLTPDKNTCNVAFGFNSGTYILSVSEITPSGCLSDTITCEIVVIVPQIIFDTNSYTICLDETLPLSATPPNGEWDSDFVTNNSFVGTMAGSFTVGYTGEVQGCEVKDNITINVKSKFGKPIITNADTLVDLCVDQNKQLYSVKPIDGVYFVWNFEDISSYSDSNNIFIFWYDTTNNYLVSVYGVDTLNCVSEKNEFYVRTVACTRVYAPNSFTPDNDGVNDIFRVSGIGIYEPRLIIFDRYGRAFFETNNLYRGWNGDDGTGYYCEDGVYNWIIYYKDAQGIKRENNGHVHLIR